MVMEKRRYSAEVATSVRNYLENDKWNFSFDEVKGVFRFDLKVGGRINKITYTILIGNNNFIVYTTLPIAVNVNDTEMLNRMMEFEIKVNHNDLNNGHFELDMEDGEIGYKIFVDCTDGNIPSEEIIKKSIYCPATVFERYTEGILSIIFYDSTADEAIEKSIKSIADKIKEILKNIEDDEIEDEMLEGEDSNEDDELINMNLFSTEEGEN